MGRTTRQAGRIHWLVVILALVAAACRGADSPPAPAAVSAPAKGHMDMLQLMRAFPFPHANVIFDTQTRDPAGPEGKISMSYSVYRWGDSDTYAGWAGVENSALALTEMAPILLAPRACANGRPAPVDREDWKKAVQGLIAAGEAAHKAARSRDLDKMLETSETLTNACAACHDVYRDVDLEGGERCTIKTE